MKRRHVAIGTTVLLALVLLVAAAGPVTANPANLTPELLEEYDVTVAQLATISSGDFPNGNWDPCALVTRGEWAQMMVCAYDIKLANPKMPTYSDVDRSNPLYKYIEGGTAAGLFVGYPDGYFAPDGPVLGNQLRIMIVERLGYNLDPAYTYLAYSGDPLTRVQMASEILHSYAP